MVSMVRSGVLLLVWCGWHGGIWCTVVGVASMVGSGVLLLV